MQEILPLIIIMSPIILMALIAVYVRLRLLAKLNDSEEYDILKLWKYRFVLPRATGQSITHINAEVQNLTDKRLQVVIFPGTYFISSGDHQNMVTCDEYHFWLNKQSKTRFSIPAACINAKRPIPGEDDYFKGVAKVSKNLIRFLKRACGEDSKVIQAGVWAITDRYSRKDIQRQLFVRTSHGNMPAISDYQIDRAKQILNSLGIQTNLDIRTKSKGYYKF
jgi:hypothetical protein